MRANLGILKLDSASLLIKPKRCLGILDKIGGMLNFYIHKTIIDKGRGEAPLRKPSIKH